MAETTITLPNVRQESAVQMHTKLKDNGVALDWTGLSGVKAYMYSDAQRVIAGKCTVEINAEDSEVLDVLYPATAPQYLGRYSLLLRCTYQGREKTFDVPVLTFVERTAQATGVTVITDPEMDVQLEVEDVSTSLLDGAIAAALDAAVRAEEAAAVSEADHLIAVADHEAAEADHTRAGQDHTQASNDHLAAAGDHTRAGEDHTAAVAATGAANDAAALANAKAALVQDKLDRADTDHTRAESDHSTAVSDHGQAGTDHTQAAGDHSTAANDHTIAGNDHTQAASDHGTAAADHTLAASDHTTAAGDHGTAGDDHTQAVSDHGTASTDHGTAVADHTQAASDHSTAAGDHTQAGTDHSTAAADHTTAGTDHTTAAADHTQAGNDHTQAGTDHGVAADDHTQAVADHAVMAGYDTRLGAVETEVNQLDQEIEDILGLPEVVINPGASDVVIGTIYQTEYRCEGVYGTNQRSRFIPIGNYKGRTIRIVAENSTNYASVCAVTQQPSLEQNSNLALATGWTGSVRVETQQDFVVPLDAEYFISYYGDIRYPSVTHDPVSMTVVGKDSAAVLKDQGVANAGKFMVVGNDGKVVPVSMSPSPTPTPTPPEDAVTVVLKKTLYLAADVAAIGTLGTGWSGTTSQGFTHASGNTDPLTLNATDEGDPYLVTIEGPAAENAFFISIGDGPLIDPYNGQTETMTAVVSDGGSVKITPASSFAGTIKVKVQKVVDEEGSVESVDLLVKNVESGTMDSALSAFWNIVLGTDNTTFGKAVSASRCIVIGQNALRNLETGSRNIAIGTFAATALKDGKGNIAIGADALFTRQGGEDNIAIGRAAMAGGDAIVHDNICIGRSAGQNASAENNICIGPVAGYNATKDSIYIGVFAGYSYTGLNNIFIGRQAGYTSGTRAGNWNIAIGASAQIANNCNKSTAIGYQASADKSSQCVIGGADCVETKLSGDVVVRGTDNVLRKIVFNNDNTVTWTTVS